MFKNINNLLILIAGLIICYIFYNVFILENFVSFDNKQMVNKKNFEYKQANELADFVSTSPEGVEFVKKQANELVDFASKSPEGVEFVKKQATARVEFQNKQTVNAERRARTQLGNTDTLPQPAPATAPPAPTPPAPTPAPTVL